MRQGSETYKKPIQIGEAAQRTELTIDTIRFYERRALLPPANRTAGQSRIYTSDDIVRLSFIKQMQGLGFSLQQIKHLLELRDRGRYACDEVSNLLRDKLREIRAKIKELQKLEGDLAIDLRRCNRELRDRRSRAPRQCHVLTDAGTRK